jgi:hypothetical protein
MQGKIMRDFFPFSFSLGNWKSAIVLSAGVLALSLAGGSQAQSQNRAGESANATPTAKAKADSNKTDAGNKGKKAQKKALKQNNRENSANYHGAQPPQGGRLGQGPD